jgi:ankyrin repeat protein
MIKGMKALMYASKEGNLEVIKTLIEKKSRLQDKKR